MLELKILFQFNWIKLKNRWFMDPFRSQALNDPTQPDSPLKIFFRFKWTFVKVIKLFVWFRFGIWSWFLVKDELDHGWIHNFQNWAEWTSKFSRPANQSHLEKISKLQIILKINKNQNIVIFTEKQLSKQTFTMHVDTILWWSVELSIRIVPSCVRELYWTCVHLWYEI